MNSSATEGPQQCTLDGVAYSWNTLQIQGTVRTPSIEATNVLHP